ncbi:lysozyme inhibitor LprI family protein [Leptotrichia hongkongensis]|jgi:Protein of unknown function (DUF1311).|uniref:lysozyme inhibitor LprI family protein n=1 Tax=Leptotrichia hongkongensis TaxID=554406 RepID=UPI0035A92E2F
MEQKNNNNIRSTLIVIIIILVTGVVFSGGFYILVTQNKMAKLEKEKGKQRNGEVENMASIQSVQPLSELNKKKRGESNDSVSNNTKNTYTVSYETEMRNRMAPIENELNYYTTANTNSCSEYVNYRIALHNKWDNELNKIYKLLMSKYPDSQKRVLKNEEIEWIKGRQRTMDSIRSEMAGCESESTVENGEIETIKARAIELAARYDKLN